MAAGVKPVENPTAALIALERRHVALLELLRELTPRIEAYVETGRAGLAAIPPDSLIAGETACRRQHA